MLRPLLLTPILFWLAAEAGAGAGAGASRCEINPLLGPRQGNEAVVHLRPLRDSLAVVQSPLDRLARARDPMGFEDTSTWGQRFEVLGYSGSDRAGWQPGDTVVLVPWWVRGDCLPMLWTESAIWSDAAEVSVILREEQFRVASAPGVADALPRWQTFPDPTYPYPQLSARGYFELLDELKPYSPRTTSGVLVDWIRARPETRDLYRVDWLLRYYR